MDFIAIDFETANSNRSSACSIGLVEVQGGKIVNKIHWLINPLQPFDAVNIGIHGITPAMVRDMPSFVELWPRIREKIEGKPIVAHNASFDMSVLRYCLDNGYIEYPNLEYYCTYQLSKRLTPDLPSYRLNDLAEINNIPLNHHNALDDANACALLLMKLLSMHHADSPRTLSSSFGFKIGKLYNGGYTPFSAPSAKKAKKTVSSESAPAPRHSGTHLIRGQKIGISNPNNRLLVEVEWNLLNPDMDIDASSFLLHLNGTCEQDGDCIFYGNPDHRSGSVVYTKINTNKAHFQIDFNRMDLHVQRLAFALSIYEDEERNHCFDQVSEIMIRLIHPSAHQEIAYFNFGEELTKQTAIIIGELYRYQSEWKFNPIGQGYFGGLHALCLDYGLEVEHTLPEVAAGNHGRENR
ncbi:DNA polymerase III epsilon subunit family exonuclease [Paenibacillus cellulosilyticus]|uniref:DNA polymerase III epsilon subunit family exonuclease n=1 Tax=Paenibacillus cellulosilyticus TaxID=375489 RepID=A0A2V2YXA2_9BACL|nr:TerD family protein [Paenibacillus cellulosilyticus]PWW06273.1 DNA polymerase III epsilon subunit family exonuclease [Paenibacillus cellulosilyticus]QKS42975.1 TerD family protein [Paenibacillus cellulosilyticus]